MGSCPWHPLLLKERQKNLPSRIKRSQGTDRERRENLTKRQTNQHPKNYLKARIEKSKTRDYAAFLLIHPCSNACFKNFKSLSEHWPDPILGVRENCGQSIGLTRHFDVILNEHDFNEAAQHLNNYLEKYWKASRPYQASRKHHDSILRNAPVRVRSHFNRTKIPRKSGLAMSMRGMDGFMPLAPIVAEREAEKPAKSNKKKSRDRSREKRKSDQATDKSTSKATDKATDKSTEKATDKATAKSTDKPSTAKSTDKPSTAKSTDKPSTAKSTDKPSTAKSTDKPSTAKSTDKPSTAKSTDKPSTAKSTDKPSTAKSTDKPSTSRGKLYREKERIPIPRIKLTPVTDSGVTKEAGEQIKGSRLRGSCDLSRDYAAFLLIHPLSNVCFKNFKSLSEQWPDPILGVRENCGQSIGLTTGFHFVQILLHHGFSYTSGEAHKNPALYTHILVDIMFSLSLATA
eukprot:sb/3464536/